MAFKSLIMNRIQYKKLLEWKNDTLRKPLIIQGARQVGKTWLMKAFGKEQFEQVVYLNFESSSRLKNLFVADFNIDRIMAIIAIETGQKIDAPNTLLIFDEIQEAEKGITSLKYFYEQAPQYFVMAAGSLLGGAIQKNSSFPVGKVDFLQLSPLSFMEFLENMGEAALAEKLSEQNWEIVAVFHDKLVELLRLYYFIGGMPEAVANYIKNKNLGTVRSIQQKILMGYENDFTKYAPTEIIPRIRLVWMSVIGQLAKENRKFVYGQIKKGSRAKDFELAINWLVDAGLIIKVNRINNATIPLNAYLDIDAFKLFFVDIGLLNALADVSPKILLEKNSIMVEFKGAMTEQFVCQQLKLNHQLFYWSASNATAEVDFVLQHENEIVPIEVKAEENLKSKSLGVFQQKYGPKVSVRVSMSPFRNEGWLVNVPLYGVGGVAGNLF